MNDFLPPPTEKNTEVLETPHNFTHFRSGLSVTEMIDSKSVHPSEIFFIPRQALQISITRHQSSLTGKELSFLQVLVVDGAEEELTKAIHVLADDYVFFEADDVHTQIRQNRPEGKDWGACGGAFDSYINSSMLVVLKARVFNLIELFIKGLYPVAICVILSKRLKSRLGKMVQ